jgi:AhpD family alkylhydroperoxidase
MSIQDQRPEEWTARVREAHRAAPEIPKAFGAFFQSIMKQGALSVREKELVALGIGIALRCVPCIDSHTQKAMTAGATRQQILETAGVAVMMQGGPAYTYLPYVVEAVNAVEAKAAATEPATA